MGPAIGHLSARKGNRDKEDKSSPRGKLRFSLKKNSRLNNHVYLCVLQNPHKKMQ